MKVYILKSKYSTSYYEFLDEDVINCSEDINRATYFYTEISALIFKQTFDEYDRFEIVEIDMEELR